MKTLQETDTKNEDIYTVGVSKVSHIIAVVSGKGGVGKSTCTAQIARAFEKLGLKVGILDVDLCGPSIPKILGIQNERVKDYNDKWLPVFVDKVNKRFPVISLGVMTDSSTAPVVWRGPRKTAVIHSFFADVWWGTLDVLLIDTPPGTSDEHISVCQILSSMNPDGAIVVTTPQGVSLDDVRKEINFCRKLNIPILGVYENMSGYVCPHCENTSYIFSSNGGAVLSKDFEVPFLGRLSIDPWLCLCEETGDNPFTITVEELSKKKEAEQLLVETIKDKKQTVAERSLGPILDFAAKFKNERIDKK